MLGLTLAVVLIQGLIGIAKFGYCGQDFDYHYNLLIGFPQTFSYKYTNPPAIYAFGQAIGAFFSGTWMLELTALALLIINTLSLWLWYSIIKRIITSREVRYAALLMSAFVPFRVVHSIVFAADALTVPIFVSVTWLAIVLFEEPRKPLRTWVKIAGWATLGVLSKYTFVGVLPALALIAFHELVIQKSIRARLLVAVTALVCLFVPLRVLLVQMDLSAKAQGVTMVSQWVGRSEDSEMGVRDLVMFGPRDAEVLSAPEYFRHQIYEPHKYSYPALLHLATFTDVLNYFQQKVDIARHVVDHKQQSTGIVRSSGVTLRSRFAVVASLPFSLLAFVGTVLIGVASLPRLLLNRGPVSRPLAIVAMLGLGFYAPVVVNITRVVGAYTAGYWLPRLVMPSLLTFLVLGFVLVDRVLAMPRFRRSPRLAGIFLAYTAVACLAYLSIT